MLDPVKYDHEAGKAYEGVRDAGSRAWMRTSCLWNTVCVCVCGVNARCEGDVDARRGRQAGGTKTIR